MQQLGFQQIYWPPNSLDLNRIETLWHRIKDCIQEHYPDIHQIDFLYLPYLSKDPVAS